MKVSTSSRTLTVRFALGVPVGFILSMLINALVTWVYPLSAPMSFFLTLSTTMATAILFARVLPLRDSFTTKERLQLERYQTLHDARKAAIDQRARQMLAHGMIGAEVEAALGPEWQRVREDYDRGLAALGTSDGTTPPALATAAPGNPMSPPKS